MSTVFEWQQWIGHFPGGSVVKNPPANAGDRGSIPGLARSPREGNGSPLQYSCWEIPWTENSGGLQSLGLQRVRHDLETKQQQGIRKSRGPDERLVGHASIFFWISWWIAGGQFGNFRYICLASLGFRIQSAESS